MNRLTYRISKGDRDAFDDLCRERYASLVSYARMFLSDDWAKDVVQDVLFSVWVGRARLDVSSDLQSYLIRSVYNRCLGILERSGSAGRYASWYRYRISSLLAADTMSPDHNPVMSKIYGSELRRSLSKAIGNLPDRCGEIFRLSYLEHVPDKEIAGMLGISVRTVEAQIYKALKALRVELSEE